MNDGSAGHKFCHGAHWVAIGACICVVTGSCAERGTTNGPTTAELATPGKANPEPTDLEFDGLIDRIGADGESITVQHWPLSKTFRVPPDCEVDVSTNVNAKLAQLKVNDPVSVIYTEVGKDLVASRIVRRGKAYSQEQQEKMERLDEMLNPSPNQ